VLVGRQAGTIARLRRSYHFVPTDDGSSAPANRLTGADVRGGSWKNTSLSREKRAGTSSGRIGASPRGPGLSCEANAAIAAALASRSAPVSRSDRAWGHGMAGSSGRSRCQSQIGVRPAPARPPGRGPPVAGQR
jgi:hypothetical protein